MKIRMNDTVQVVAGKDKGKQGKVVKVVTKYDKVTKQDVVKVVVEGVNKVTKHIKAHGGQAGQKVEVEAPIHVSNVMIVCPKTSKPTRVGITRTKDGDKQRVAKKSGEVISAK